MTLSLPLAKKVSWAALAAVAITLSGACQKPPEPPPPPGPRVESPGLGIVIGELPAFFKVAVNEGEELKLEPASGEAGVELELSASPPESGGINLVAASHEYKAEVEAGGGENFGADPTEYASPLGTTMYNRASVETPEGSFGEMVVFVIHPWQDRKLKFRYRFPATEDPEKKQARIDELMNVVGEVVGLPMPVEPEATQDDGEAGATGAAQEG